jgi:hypothetical protein
MVGTESHDDLVIAWVARQPLMKFGVGLGGYMGDL